MPRPRIKVTPVTSVPEGARFHRAPGILWEILTKKLPEGCPAGSLLFVERDGMPSYYAGEPTPAADTKADASSRSP